MGWSINAKSISIPQGVVKQISANGSIIWKAPSGVSYVPILPNDTDVFPLYLKDYDTKVYDSSAGGTDSIVASTHDGYTTIRNVTGLFSTPWTALVMPWFCTHFACSCNNNVTDVADGMVLAYAMTLLRLFTTVNNDTVGILSSDSNNTKITKFKSWLDSEKANDTPVTVLYPVPDSGKLWFAVTDGTSYGYYNPTSGEFVAAYGMTGEVIHRVTFLESDGGQYIDTGIIGNSKTVIVLDIAKTVSDTSVMQLLGTITNSSRAISANIASASTAVSRFGSKSNTGNVINDIDRHTIEIANTGYKVDGTLIWQPNASEFTTPDTIILLGANGSSSRFTGKIYSTKLWNDITLTRDYIPVRVGSTGYLLNIASWALSANEGTGVFIYGNDTGEQIPFPTTIYEDPVLLTMGGNPFYPPDPEPEPEE